MTNDGDTSSLFWAGCRCSATRFSRPGAPGARPGPRAQRHRTQECVRTAVTFARPNCIDRARKAARATCGVLLLSYARARRRRAAVSAAPAGVSRPQHQHAVVAQVPSLLYRRFLTCERTQLSCALPARKPTLRGRGARTDRRDARPTVHSQQLTQLSPRIVETPPHMIILQGKLIGGAQPCGARQRLL